MADYKIDIVSPTYIRLAKIYKDYLVIAYAEGHVLNNKRIVIGEVKNWKTGDHMRLLSYGSGDLSYCGLINTMDFHDNYLFTGSSFPCKWDLTSKDCEEYTADFTDFNRKSMRVSVLGRYVIFSHTDHLRIYDGRKMLSTNMLRNHQMKFQTSKQFFHKDNERFLSLFELKGKFLITEMRKKLGKLNDLEDLEEYTVTIYDLSKNPKINT